MPAGKYWMSFKSNFNDKDLKPIPSLISEVLRSLLCAKGEARSFSRTGLTIVQGKNAELVYT